MKKYLFGVFALALAVGFSSFKAKKAELHFQYQLTTYTQAQVENVANYAQSSIECPSQDNKACEITVDSDNTMNGQSQLDPSKVTIVSQDGDFDSQFGIDDVTVTSGARSWLNKN